MSAKKQHKSVLLGVVAAAMLVFVLANADFRKSLDGWLGGLGYGLSGGGGLVC